MQIPQDPVRPGQEVRVRGARWRIADIQPCGACRIVTLTGLAPANVGVARRVLDPFDSLEPIDRSRAPAIVGIRRWRRACRAVIAADTPPGSLCAARSARIDLMPHQLEPALALVGGMGTRVLLADEVGLGKTIQAALIVAELRARGWIDRVLVLTPAGLREQWVRELNDRFDIDAKSVDAHVLRRLAATLPIGMNPWATVQTAIASTDYVKRSEVLPAVTACRWDVVVVDEAHGVAGESERQTAIRALGSRAAYLLLLTATPHSGDQKAFDTLCDLGSAASARLLAFRRSRSDVGIAAHRRVHTVRVRRTARERRMYAALERYGDAVRAESGGAWLALSVLHKRAFSGAWSLGRSVERRLAALAQAPAAVDAEQMTLPLGDLSGECATGDEPPVWPDGLALHDPAREHHLLTELARACQAAIAAESKISALARVLRRTNESAVVFTEYRDTLLHVQRRLIGMPLVILHGGMTRDERHAALAAFSGGARMILLATDAAGEGLNLHHSCRLVINLELPWNPMRLEQRIGRVDRIGQRRTVHAIHLVAHDTGETWILDRLKRRIAEAQLQLAAPDPIGVNDEKVIARFVATQDPSTEANRVAALSAEPDAQPPAIITADLGPAAAAEAGRLRLARALSTDSDDALLAALDGAGPWIVRASRRRLRIAIGSKALLIWRVVWENRSGRILGSRLVPMTVDVLPRYRSRADLKRTVRELAAHLASAVELSCRDWREAVDREVGRFVSARVVREHEIAAGLHSTVPAGFQPGLFDHRAERAHRLELDSASISNDEAVERIASLERAADGSARPPDLVLVLLP